MKKQSTPSKKLKKEIRQQSESEAAVIIGQAEKEAEHILDQARSEAEKIQSEMLKKAEKQAEFIRKRVLSGVHLEIKKQNLQAREAMLSQLFQLVQEKLERFRKSSKYASVLENMIIEGALALGSEKLELMVGEV
jgi:vacuolar-type H+-ATPase subunit E/Vma4